MTIYQQITQTAAKVANHESDLYAEITSETEAIVNAYEFKGNVTRFRSNVDGVMMFDIPFAYDPFWESKQA